MSILLTGGCGYIGSHCAVELLNNTQDNIIILDDLSNSDSSILDNIHTITNKKIQFYNCNINNEYELNKIFQNNIINTVIHFAAFKAVKESVDDPLKYYSNNISGLITLLNVMKNHKVSNIIFSSSATVYGTPDVLPLTEAAKISPCNPYGRTKYFAEEILKDVSHAYHMKVVCLRYFNPVGSHSSGLLRENPKVPSNLFPCILEVINGKKDFLNIYGNDYDTSDGTAIRDYINVVDLPKGNLAAYNYLTNMDTNYNVFNLGTGKGYSVLEIVNMFSKILGREVPYKIQEKREGDAPEVYSDFIKANIYLQWKAELTLTDMVKDSL